MSELQLDLFAEVADVPVDVCPCLPHTREPSDIRDARQSAKVEPLRFILSDPDERWTITAAHLDEVKRGKATRRLVGRCSCGWVSEFGLHSFGQRSPDRLLAHLRSHQLESRPPAWQVEGERVGWRKVRLLDGRVHCASADCHRLAPLPGRRRSEPAAEHRLTGGFGEPCFLHGGLFYDRLYHWEEHDPEDHSGEPRWSFAGGLLDPQGVFWHFWCAPLEGRRPFGFLRDEERSTPADDCSDIEGSIPMSKAQPPRPPDQERNGAP